MNKIQWKINFKKKIKSYFEGDIEIFFYEDKIFPEKAIHKREAYQIIEILPHMYINNYFVTTCDKKIRSVNAFGFHPNVDPCSNALCLPSDMPDALYNEETKNRIETILKTYNIDSCHFNPLSYIKLIKLDSLAVNRNKGK